MKFARLLSCGDFKAIRWFKVPISRLERDHTMGHFIIVIKTGARSCANHHRWVHYDDVRMGAIASQITSLTIVYWTVYSDADQRKHQSSASLAFVRGIHRGPVNSPHKGPVTRKMFPFDDVIMLWISWSSYKLCPIACIGDYHQIFVRL